MTRIAYVKSGTRPGMYVPRREALVPMEDRGFVFADGVYEVCEFRDGRLVDEDRHIARYEASLASLRIRSPMSRRSLQSVLRETIRRNPVLTGLIYFQVTRGVAPRDHAFPSPDTPTTLIVFVSPIDVGAREDKWTNGVSVTTMRDERWHRRDIKSVSLLPNILAKQRARDAGAYEAWLVDDDGFVTEGASTNAWICTRDGVLVTRSLGPEILPGVSRAIVMGAARETGVQVEERGFTVEEAYNSSEAFLTSSSSMLIPVVAIDAKPVNKGRPGPLSWRLRDAAFTISRLSDRQLPPI